LGDLKEGQLITVMVEFDWENSRGNFFGMNSRIWYKRKYKIWFSALKSHFDMMNGEYVI